jgi:uncharacterized protein YegL
LTTGILTLYEGVTISHPAAKELPPRWKALAIGGTAETVTMAPIMMAYESADRSGRIVLDTGFTKLWLNWNTGATDRYTCNATAWLTGVDKALKPMTLVTHPRPNVDSLRLPRNAFTPKQPTGSQLAALQANIDAVLPPGFDFVLVLDMSGSMSSFYSQARTFARELAGKFQIGQPGSRNRMALVPFGSTSRVVANFDTPLTQLYQQIDLLGDMGGTYFAPPLQMAQAEFQSRSRPGQKRLVIFQTDGENADHAAASNAARALVNEVKATVYAVAVIMNPAETTRISQKAACVTGNAGQFDDPGKGLTLVRTLANYNELVREVSSIVASAMRAA